MILFKLIRKTLSRLSYWMRHSQYSRPIIFFLCFFVVAATATVFFEIRENSEQFDNLLDGFWWAIITFSTTGYGDKVPITVGGRILAIFTIVIGVSAMSLLSGGLASWLVERNTRARRGLVDYSFMKDHIIICGWKEDMGTILHYISEGAQKALPVVLISNVANEKIEELQDHEELRGLKFVRGDYFSETTLLRAGIAKASKVMVLADALESTAISEVDSKTVLTVLTIKSIARNVYVVAEILDRKYESYLKQAACDEVVFSRDMSRQLLASTAQISGISHIFYNLLAPRETGVRLTTISIPSEYVNRSYNQFRLWVENNSNRRLIGLLENIGSPALMKIESLREAQKTSNISLLVENLQLVKKLETNRPVFIPEPDYVVQHHSLGIVIERKEA